ncbi:hypothetical protein MVEG_08901 [Podila verticillata NRRL 6337]|nr:hypothetical protein MVEG_08901 [Podila verticillata NRRL 6337]
MPAASKPTRAFVPLPGIEYATAVHPYVKLTPNPNGGPKITFTPEEVEAVSKPNVLISGGGIGGLTLALLLHKANIPFLVFERAKEITPLGSAISMGPSVAALFKQLGIWDEFVERSKEYHTVNMYNEDLKLMNTLTLPWLEEAAGCQNSIISRPQLYDLLLHSIPRDRILLGKRILSFSQNEDNVMIDCSDNTSYYGDILVGADGAYSAVRQNLYKQLKKVHKLPSSDDWVTNTTAQNTVCWSVIHFLDKDSSKRHDSFRNSEWGPEAAEALAREVHVFKVPGGKDGKNSLWQST